MKVTHEEHGDIMVLGLIGNITIGEGDITLRREVNKALESGFKKIVLDLKKVKYVDSSGVGEMVAAYTTVKNKEGELKLVNLNSKILDLLQITALVTVFTIHDTKKEALESFA
ncbi:MAG: anti-anti-sigma factor [Acidobacteria bacterium]|nr:MAG: anti-anti-sigma factor [Acidobacteriota bacterium]PIE90057.1 MAG: anti-anti-sigma factor [Acidobacteriota bacterium]